MYVCMSMTSSFTERETPSFSVFLDERQHRQLGETSWKGETHVGKLSSFQLDDQLF